MTVPALARADATLEPAPETLPGAVDALARLQALSVQIEQARPQRGPFRPERLVTTRERQSDRLSAHYFRAMDGLAVAGLTLLAVWLATPNGLATATLGQAAPFALAAFLLLVGLKALDLYAFPRRERLSTHLQRIAVVAAVAGAAGVLLALGSGLWLEAATWTVAAFALTAGLHALWWRLVRGWREAGRLTPNIVIVGANQQAERFIQEAMARRDLNVLGVFDDRLARSPRAVAGVPLLGDTEALVGHRIMPFVDRIVLAVDPAARQRVQAISQRLATLPNAVSLIVDQDGAAQRDEALARLADAPLAPLDGRADDDRRAVAKRMQDLILGSAALVALAPVLGLIALAVRMDSPGPAFFRQRRHGFNNEEIVVWKFRSMRVETADARAERQVTADDDRVTKLGRFIRKTSLDELPQLLNVISGEMSLVGPRPHAVGMKTGEDESARLVAEYAHRHRMKPGMTGWAAVNGSRGPLHSAADVRRRIQLDIDYIDRQSFWLDLWIMLITIPVLLGDRDAVR